MIPPDSPLMMVVPQTRYAVSDRELDTVDLRTGFDEVWSQFASAPDQGGPTPRTDPDVAVPTGDAHPKEAATPQKEATDSKQADPSQIRLAERQATVTPVPADDSSRPEPAGAVALQQTAATGGVIPSSRVEQGATPAQGSGKPRPEAKVTATTIASDTVARAAAMNPAEGGRQAPLKAEAQPSHSGVAGSRMSLIEAVSRSTQMGTAPVDGGASPAITRGDSVTSGHNKVADRPVIGPLQPTRHSAEVLPATEPKQAMTGPHRGHDSISKATPSVSGPQNPAAVPENGGQLFTTQQHKITSVPAAGSPPERANTPLAEGGAKPAQPPLSPLSNVTPTDQARMAQVTVPDRSVTRATPHVTLAAGASAPSERIAPEMLKILASPAAPVSPEPRDTLIAPRPVPPQTATQITAQITAAVPFAPVVGAIPQVNQLPSELSLDAEQILISPTTTPATVSPTTIAQATAHPHQPTVAQQITTAIIQASGRTTEISLNPEELGRVRISLTPADTGMTVTIFSERPETADLMRRNIELLAQEFSDLGYENLSFNFESPDDGFNENGQRDDPHQSEADPGAIPTDATTPHAVSVALSGGLDLKL